MSGSDSDYEDLGEIVLNEDNGRNETGKQKKKANGKVIRGPDKCWIELLKFDDIEAFKGSDLFKNIEEEFTKRKTREYGYADVLEYSCKFTRRTGFLPCPWILRVVFPSHNTEVIVETIEGVDNHDHKEDPDFVEEASSNFRWSEEMSSIVEENIHYMPNVILRKLKNANVFGRKIPTKTQLYNKMSALKKAACPRMKILNTHELRQSLANLLETPESKMEAFVPFHNIEDSNDDEDPRFTIIFTTTKNMEKMRSDRVLQTDATYRLNWLGFPVFVVGKTFSTMITFCMHFKISSNKSLQGHLLQLASSLEPVLFCHRMRIHQPGLPFSTSSEIQALSLDIVWGMGQKPLVKQTRKLLEVKAHIPGSCAGLTCTEQLFHN